jgi:hypothetical protein
MASPADRMNHVLELRPEICSLDVATMNFGKHAFVNTPDHITEIAEAVRAAGVKPELEVFDLGHIALAKNLYAKGLFADPPFFQLCLGVPWGAPATTEAMLAMKAMLPANANWSCFGVGAQHFPDRGDGGGERRACPRGAGGQPLHVQGRAGRRQCPDGRPRRPHHPRNRGRGRNPRPGAADTGPG